MKKLLSLFLSIVLTLGVFCTVPFTELPFKLTASAASASDLTFKLNDDGKSYCVSGCKKSASGSLTIPATYKKLPVTSVGDSAFKGCTGLKSVKIGSGVTLIGKSAFYGCTGLKSLTISNSVKEIDELAFGNCTALTSVEIPGNVKELKGRCTDYFYDKEFFDSMGWDSSDEEWLEGHGVFAYCSALESVTLNTGLTVLGDATFYGCEKLQSVTIPGSVTSIGKSAFYGCKGLKSVTISNGVKEIDESAFRMCTGLTSVKIPSSVKEIKGSYDAGDDSDLLEPVDFDEVVPYGAFSYCSSLTSVTLNEGLTVLGDATFYGCKKLKSVTIPSSVKNIGEYAFEDCAGLTSVKISNGVKSIGRQVFRGCTSLTSVTIPNSVTSIGKCAFYRCQGLTSVTIGTGVKSIGDDAFDGCGKLNSVYITDLEKWLNIDFSNCYSNPCSYAYNLYLKGKTLTNPVIPDTVKRVKPYVFYNNKTITSITIPNSVTSIGEGAFRGCGNLKTLKIGTGVKTIGDEAFCNCKNLTSITIPDNVTRIGKDAFLSTGYYNKSSNWKNGLLYIGTNLITAKRNLKTSYTVKNGTRLIADFAFYDGVISYCEDRSPTFKFISIPKSVKYIGESAFGYYEYEPYSDGRYETYPRKISGFTVYGISGTKAQTYAKDNGFKFVNVTKPGTVKLSGAANASTGVKVSWSKVDNVSTYTVYRKSGSNGYKAIKSGITGTSYIDTTAKSNNTYTYTVRATNVAGTGGYNKTGKSVLYLAMPKPSASNASTGVTLKWAKVTGAKGYYVYRKTGNNGWSRIATLSGNGKVSYTDKSAKSGTTYKYTVRAYNGNTVSAYNTTGVSIKCLAVPKLASISSTKSGVTFKWNKVTGANGYYVYRKTGNGSWSKIATVSGNGKVSYLDTSAKKGTTYTYTVKAYSGKSVSAYNTTGLKIKDKY